jgi:1-acyl-sn-glycerol-3-phosphate acyltransferase
MNAEPRVVPAESRWQSLWYDSVFLASHWTLTLGFSLRTRGARHMPRHGPALVIANHQSFLDPVAIALAVRRQLVPLARKTLFHNPFFGALIRSLGAVPIDQEGVGKEGIRAIGEQLQKGRAVLVFPEGTRTPDGSLQPFRPGIHLLLRRAPAPIVPVGIAGAYDAWPATRGYPLATPLFLPRGRGTVAVAVGKPLAPQRYVDLPRQEALAELEDRVREVCAQAELIRRHGYTEQHHGEDHRIHPCPSR